MAPICARNCATRSCCCCATRPVAARARPRGKSPSTSAPAPIAAIICNHSRRVLLVTLRLTVHLPSRVAVQYVRGGVEGKVHLPPRSLRESSPLTSPVRESSPPLPPLPSGEGEPCATSREHMRKPQQHALRRGVSVWWSELAARAWLYMDPLRRVPPGRKFTQARELRRAATSTERYAWSLLRKRGVLGLKFRRQHVLHGFVVDFYCAAERLVLELEGAPHAGCERRANDAARAATLEAAGYRVIRIARSEEHTSELQSLAYLVCRLLLEKKKKNDIYRQDAIA